MSRRLILLMLMATLPIVLASCDPDPFNTFIDWKIQNKLAMPVEIRINFDGQYERTINGIITANLTTASTMAIPSTYPLSDETQLEIKAYEFIVGEGTHFGWYDSYTRKTYSGTVSSNLLFCKKVLWKNLNREYDLLSIVIDSKIEC